MVEADDLLYAKGGVFDRKVFPTISTRPTISCKNDAGQLVPCTPINVPIFRPQSGLFVPKDPVGDPVKAGKKVTLEKVYANYYGGYAGYYPYNYFGGYTGYYPYNYYGGYIPKGGVVSTRQCKNVNGQLVVCAHGGDSIIAQLFRPQSFPNIRIPVVPIVAQPSGTEQAAPAELDSDSETVCVDCVTGPDGLKKREAEAEADPYLLYANYYGGYAGYYPYNYYRGYYGYYGHPYYAGYGCRNNYGAFVPCA